MMFPVRCMSCGKPIGHLWEKYKAQVIDKGADAKAVLDSLGVEKYCCRAMFISHVDLVQKVGRFNKLATAEEKAAAIKKAGESVGNRGRKASK